MSTNIRLDQLMQRAIEDKREEPAFFRALLDAAVYAHAPLSDGHPRLRLIQFTRPDGLTVVPVFTDREKAETAAGSAVRIVAMSGRQLMAAAPGATLMLNPNDHHCTLYPEEIRSLLATGTLPVIRREDTTAPRDVWIGMPDSVPAWLIDHLTQTLATMPFVERGYLVSMKETDSTERITWVIVLAVAPEYAERAARAVITMLQAPPVDLETAIDLTTFDPATGCPSWIDDPEVQPFYERSWGQRLQSPARGHSQ